MAVVEALADGVPVLASDLGGLPELVGTEAALPARDLDAWTTALHALWSDAELRAARGAAGLARARERHSPQAQYEALLRTYAVAGRPERAAA